MESLFLGPHFITRETSFFPPQLDLGSIAGLIPDYFGSRVILKKSMVYKWLTVKFVPFSLYLETPMG